MPLQEYFLDEQKKENTTKKTVDEIMKNISSERCLLSINKENEKADIKLKLRVTFSRSYCFYGNLLCKIDDCQPRENEVG